MNLEQYIKSNLLHVRVKPSAVKTEILGYDEARKTVKIAVAAPPENNKANIALLKFVKKTLGRTTKLRSGATSSEKVLEIS